MNNKIQNILIIDDEPDIRELLEITLGRMGLQSQSAGTVAEGRELLDQQEFDLCLTDMRLPDGTGIEIVEYIQNKTPQTPVAVITAYGSMDTAIQALKAGAFDFVSKPVDLTMLRELIGSALKLSKTSNHTKPRPSKTTITDRFIGQSSASKKLVETIGKLARSQAPVFIYGESGSGKELVARSIHELSPRSVAPFIAVNCGAIPAELMESEFFGHLKGSFTGAMSDKDGLFRAANGGTLFLDEIAELPLAMQVKLLRAIQERAVKPVGAHQEIPIDVRILSATHKDLDEEMEAGRFRQDLYFRINVIRLDVPPLRNRKKDLLELIEVLLVKLQERWGSAPFSITEEALAILSQYPFPGNVRELENILERAATLCENNTINADDLDLPKSEFTDPNYSPHDTLTRNIQAQEAELIQEALEQTRWNQTAAAKKLGMTLRQLRYRIQKLGLNK
jgi:two-component system response regulator PilR (NtrC family)